jgi:hypothetical protein
MFNGYTHSVSRSTPEQKIPVNRDEAEYLRQDLGLGLPAELPAQIMLTVDTPTADAISASLAGRVRACRYCGQKISPPSCKNCGAPTPHIAPQKRSVTFSREDAVYMGRQMDLEMPSTLAQEIKVELTEAQEAYVRSLLAQRPTNASVLTILQEGC